jgi:polysaccharide pyruvyl transferase WcaK-like protein
MARERFLFVGNSTYMNHGSEAIVRGTVEILRKIFQEPRFVSVDLLHYPYKRIRESDEGISHKVLYYPKPGSLSKYFFQISKGLLTREIAYKLYVRQILREMREADAVLFLGGDGFINKPYYPIACSHQALRLKKTTLIWGASIGPFGGSVLYRRRVFKHLGKLTGLFVRETTTQAYLADNNVTENVYLVEDPAFVMKSVEPADKKFIEELPEGAIGISLSSLFLRKTRFRNQMKAGVYEIVEAIRRHFRRPIVLIGHCVTDGISNDYELLNSVLRENESRWHNVICLPRFMPAAEIKWVISRLYCLVAARTHATIASFSSFVPTVSLIYSFKGMGINQRFFGDLRYAVTKEDCSVEAVVEKLGLVLTNHGEIRRILQEKMPEVKTGSIRAGEYLKSIMSKTNR